MQEGIDKVNQELKDEAEKQKRTAKNLAAVSPYSDFLYAVTDLTETGLHNMDYFKRISSEYENIIDKYREIKGIPQRLYYDGSALDFSDHPRFTYREEPLRERLAVVLPWWGMLIVFNVVFFAGAFTAFLRYDVR